jgi:hypothetical protein
MKRKLFFILLTACTSIIIFSSCKKDDIESKTKNLTTGSWKMTGYERDFDKDGTFEENTFATIVDCYKDNIYTFQSNGDVIMDEGATKCNVTDPQAITLTWSLEDDGSILQWQGYENDIIDLSSTTLKIKRRTSYNFIYTIDVRLTFTKQ